MANEIIPYLIIYVTTLFVESLWSGFVSVSVNSNKSRRKQSMAKGEKEKNMTL